jgi:hypothetical protein
MISNDLDIYLLSGVNMDLVMETTKALEKSLDKEQYELCLTSLKEIINYHQGSGEKTEIVSKILNLSAENDIYSSFLEFRTYCETIKKLTPYWFKYEMRRLKNNEIFPNDINPPYFMLLARFYYCYLLRERHLR